ncbi:cold-shock protein [Manganibacter manganicus]|uniref:CSD domain-containing protein n=1 Tax=Manganibacter manganicus TaxID=1873176 RepID=A0A1V8RWI9_9HYPH|nr:cold shock domain-containing protein [Pseudaminobacter manganicus]OQM77567.1 hypothetical protein BFN67_01650 [Pseudaminobacter manganicus]
MPIGTFQFWNEDRGFGRITDDAEPDGRGVFVHVSAIPDRRSPEHGARYRYGLELGVDGRTKAVNLRLVTAEEEEVARVFG